TLAPGCLELTNLRLIRASELSCEEADEALLGVARCLIVDLEVGVPAPRLLGRGEQRANRRGLRDPMLELARVKALDNALQGGLHRNGKRGLMGLEVIKGILYRQVRGHVPPITRDQQATQRLLYINGELQWVVLRRLQCRIAEVHLVLEP